MTDDARLRGEFLKYGELEGAEAKSQFLHKLQSQDPETAARLQRLIQAAAINDSFLEKPVIHSLHRAMGESPARHARIEADVAELMSQLQGDKPGILHFGAYELRRLIKSGSEAIVFEAYDPHIQRRVALKCLLPSALAQPQRRDQILAEARILARVRDPHVVEVHAVLEQGDLRAILLPWIQGPTLESLLAEKGKPSLPQAIRIALGLIQGVIAVHRAGIVHRDLKPANVILDENHNRPVIVDFGLASDGSDADEIIKFCGTPVVMAPEVLRGGAPTAAADRFALGCTLYQLFTGVLPFQADEIEVVFRQILEADPNPPSKLCPEMPSGVENALLNLLKKDPAQRAGSLDEIRERLERWAEAIENRSLGLTPSTTHSRRRWPVFTGGIVGLGLILALVLGGRFLFQESIPEYRVAMIRTTPSRPADRDLYWPTTEEDPRLQRVHAAVVTQEKNELRSRYWRPIHPGVWAEVEYRVPIENVETIEYASLTAVIGVFGTLDLSASAELYIRGLGETQWLRVSKLGPEKLGLLGAGAEMDVTDLCRKTGGVEVMARLFANRTLVTPGPDDVIGPASAQFLRDDIEPDVDVGALRVKIWDKPGP